MGTASNGHDFHLVPSGCQPIAVSELYHVTSSVVTCPELARVTLPRGRQPAHCGPEIMINIIIDRMEEIEGGLDSRMFVLIKLTARDLPNQP